MIKNFKWLLLVSITFAACNNDDDVVEAPVVITSGSANFSNYVSLGNSLTAGYSDGALYIKGQENSWAKILSEQFMLAGGGEFRVPYVNDNIGGLLLGGNIIAENRLIFNGSAPVRLMGTPTTEIGVPLTGPFNNMGVPGAKSYHLLAPGYGNVAGLLSNPRTANPYFVRFASSPSTSILADAMAQSPTFFTLWIGNNDVLGYATTGGDGSDPITPVTGAPGVGFDGTYNTIVGTLVSGGAKGALANIPYVTTIPFFTTVPLSPLTAAAIGGGDATVGQANIAALNAQLYGPLKQALTFFGAGDRINLMSTTAANPLLIKDESLPNLSAQLTAAFTPTLGAGVAAVYGQIYGQARQTKVGDLVLLTTQGVIGTAPVGIPAPINAYGISYPLEDKHVLIPTEIAELKAATDAYNITISAAASANGLAFVDANALLTQLASGGIVSNTYTLTSALVFGGAFSLDGVHPTSRGYALIANEFSKAINATYGSNLPSVNIGNYNSLYPVSLP
jgi:hypothetical protein